MTTLLLVVCLNLADPSSCREEHVTVPEGMNCLRHGQIIGLEWLEDHPKWSLKGWRCRMGGKERGA